MAINMEPIVVCDMCLDEQRGGIVYLCEIKERGYHLCQDCFRALNSAMSFLLLKAGVLDIPYLYNGFDTVDALLCKHERTIADANEYLKDVCGIVEVKGS